jgi:hypothetical protein
LEDVSTILHCINELVHLEKMSQVSRRTTRHFAVWLKPRRKKDNWRVNNFLFFLAGIDLVERKSLGRWEGVEWLFGSGIYD